MVAKLRRRPLLLIFLLGLVLRLGFLGVVQLTGNLEIAEGAIFRDLAQNILDGRGMSISPRLLDVRPGAPEHVLRSENLSPVYGGNVAVGHNALTGGPLVTVLVESLPQGEPSAG